MQEATGFRSDVETLLSNFIDTDSVRFEDFSRIYKEMSFSLIFYLLEDEELIIFTETAYSITRSFLQPKFQFQVRVGALYLLYALYSQQPLTDANRVKIKFTAEQWTEFVDLIVEVKQQEHHDTNFIFYQLYACKAFFIVAHPEAVVMNKEQSKANASASSQLRESISLDNYLDPNLLRSLEEVHRKYESTKADLSAVLSGNESSLLTNQLHMCNNNLLSDVASQFTQFSELIGKMQNDGTTDNSGAPEQKSQSGGQQSEPEVSVEKAVKLRAMSSQVSLPRHFTSIIKDEPSSQSTTESNPEPIPREEAEAETSSSSTQIDDSYAANELFAAIGCKEKKLHFSTSYKKRTRSIMSNPISTENFIEGAISLQNSGELPYIKNSVKAHEKTDAKFK